MVFKNIARIKSALPEVLHVVMFYSNGTVFQTTFEQEINIPKLGENLAELINHIKSVYELCKFKVDVYKKLIFETEDISVIILKLGEDSNIALFFKKEEEKELKLTAIKRYITKIEELIDMDEKELIFQDILVREEEVKHLKEELQKKKEKIEKVGNECKNIEEGIIEGDVKKVTKELGDLELECVNLNRDIEKKSIEIAQLKEKIEKSRK